MKKCKYLKNDYCMYNDSICKPNGVRCFYYANKTHTFYSSSSSKKNSITKIKKTNKGYSYKNVYGNLKQINAFDVITTIYIYSGSLLASKKNLCDCKLGIRDLITKEKIYIYVVYNMHSHKYYLSIHQLTELVKNHSFNIIIKYANSKECTEPIDFKEFKQNSLLSLYGYRVGQKGLTSNHRHHIIKFLIDNKIMSAHKIISLLNSNIALRQGNISKNYSKAINDWKQDINFTADYKINH